MSRGIFFACMALCFCSQAIADPRGRLDEYIHYDQNYNVIRRSRTEAKARANLLTEEEKKDRRIAYFLVPKASPFVAFSTSRSISPSELQSLVHRDSRGREFYVLPVLMSEKASYRRARIFWGPPITQGIARKLLGRTSHAVYGWEAGSDDFFVKWIGPVPGRNIHALRALMANDYIESGNALLPNDLRSHVLNDVAVLELGIGWGRSAVSFRSTRKLTPSSPNGKIYPAHGLLGCDSCVETIAAKIGLSARQWKKQVLLKKLARFTAYSHFVLGVFYETHTQNLLIEVDEVTGDIIKLYTRDLGDAVLHPMIRLAWGDSTYDDAMKVRVLPLVAHHFFADPNIQEASEAGPNTATYTLQSVGAHLLGFQRRAKDSILFLEYYMDAYREIFGETPVLSAETRDLIGEVRDLIEDSNAETHDSRGATRKEMVSQAIQEIFDQGEKLLVSRLLRKVDASIDQKILRQGFERALHRRELTFATADARESLLPSSYKDWALGHATHLTGLRASVGSILGSLTYGSLEGGQIVAMDPDTGDILASTIYGVLRDSPQTTICQRMFAAVRKAFR